VLARVDISAQQGTVPVSSPVSAASTAGVTAVGLVNGTMDTTGQGDTGNSTLAWMPYTSFPSAALQVCTHAIILKYAYICIYILVCSKQCSQCAAAVEALKKQQYGVAACECLPVSAVALL
jgi:hypothetical protein